MQLEQGSNMYIALLIGVSILGCIFWRLTSVGRGAKTRNRKIFAEIQSLIDTVQSGKEIDREEVLSLGHRHEMMILREASNPTNS